MQFRQFIETLEQQGRDEYTSRYRVGDRTFEVWVRRTGSDSGRITYLRAYGQGNSSFNDVLPQFVKDLKEIGIINVDYSTAVDDKTQGHARERLFSRLKSKANEL